MTQTIPAKQLFDADGFVTDAGGWNELAARRIARLDGLGDLDECQLRLLRHLRASYLHSGAVPSLPHICRLSSLEPTCMTRLFPNAREAWRIAGLPNPGEEAKAYL
ncbi:MAG TPA: TusE/DsrC/DsvC family sulfur relay protein [Thiobacillaceae bacterium]|nr:TusE/DsrC/DsvC family sulfur relay protein [Thiobacillaceae bacterium]